jgi:hypothetical protein
VLVRHVAEFLDPLHHAQLNTGLRIDHLNGERLSR